MAAPSARLAIGSAADLLAVAAARQADAIRRYRALAAWWEGQDDHTLAALFDRLAQMGQEHATAAPASGAVPTAAPPDDEAWRSALLTPYRALSLAVREKERGFAFYAEAAAHAATPALRALAEDLARGELDGAAILRRARRTAYHRERAQPPPAAPADLAALERQSAAWEAEVAAATTRAARLRALSRNAERYLGAAEQTKNEAVLTAAQLLAARTLRRLAAERTESDTL